MSLIFAAFDTETTGLEPGDHRLIEVYIGYYGLDGLKHGSRKWRINPERSIAAAAQAVHGISLSELLHEPVWTDVATDVRRGLEKPDFIVAHNGIAFDMPFVNHEFRRVGLDPIDKPVVDTMLAGRWAHPYGKVPNLGELCWACDIPYDPSKAHAAEYDCEVMAMSFVRGLQWGFFALPAELKLEESA